MLISRNHVVSDEYFPSSKFVFVVLNSGQCLNLLCMTLITGVDPSVLVLKFSRLTVLFSSKIFLLICPIF